MNEDKEIGRFVTTFGKRPQLESKELYFWLNKGKGWLARAELDRTLFFADLCTRIAGYYCSLSSLPRGELADGLEEAYKVLAEQEESYGMDD